MSQLMATVPLHNVGSVGNGDACSAAQCVTWELTFPILDFLLSFSFIPQSKFRTKCFPRIRYYCCCKPRFGGLNEEAWVYMVQCYSDIFQTALGLCLYLYKSTFCCFLRDLWSNPWPLAWQACSVSTIIYVWCFTTAMLRSTKSVLALLCSFWVRNYKCVVVQFWFKASHDAAIMAATESEVIEGCTGLEGWFLRSLSYITRKVVLGVGGRP